MIEFDEYLELYYANTCEIWRKAFALIFFEKVVFKEVVFEMTEDFRVKIIMIRFDNSKVIIEVSMNYFDDVSMSTISIVTNMLIEIDSNVIKDN